MKKSTFLLLLFLNLFIYISSTDIKLGSGKSFEERLKEEDLDKVKTKFFKANYTKRGSGIGLAVADEIVRFHGGKLNIESVENKGTSVEIMLPILEPLEENE